MILKMKATDSDFITLIDKNNEEIEGEIIHLFTLDSNGNDYMMYTLGELDANTATVYVSQVIEHKNKIELVEITSQKVIKEIEKVIKDLMEG